ncbi:MAG: hypothetical protein Q8N99_01805 [Nanoarchaeota archaeon]|nr:hypothetical protein [Nanoarchaeota archaeon]
MRFSISDIINILSIIENSVSKGKNPNLEELKYRLNKHSKFEDEVFYPRLDEMLPDHQKDEIINKAKEIIIG